MLLFHLSAFRHSQMHFEIGSTTPFQAASFAATLSMVAQTISSNACYRSDRAARSPLAVPRRFSERQEPQPADKLYNILIFKELFDAMAELGHILRIVQISLEEQFQ